MNFSGRRRHVPLILGAWLAACATALATDLAFTNAVVSGAFLLATEGNPLPIVCDAAETRAVSRASGDLAEDFARVTGHKCELLPTPGAAKQVILVGTLGVSKAIDDLAAAAKLDVSGVRGQWESYALQIVTNPLPGVERALVIAGSDRRGTVYGIYHLSELIGVSPWYWWADVPVRTNQTLALTGSSFKQGPPAVKYRGIFLNDEDWGLRPWAAQTFDTNTANIGPKTYEKVFELLLRLRANYLWPAMHEGTRAFNSFPINKELADAYGIVMGSSHCEPMLRNNVSEWDAKKYGEYDYVKNREGVLRYWEERVRENGKFENVYTVGMRGIHDSGMPGGGSAQEKAQRLHEIIKDQRELLARLVNTNVAAVPQIFVPYKEALELYRLEPDLPEDITIVWPDDNYGYVRQFSNAAERRRSGGAGVYYHASYLGQPASYLWLCSTPPALIAEEMTKAYAYGADRVWVLNVGDLKPAEMVTEFFLNLAWNPASWQRTNTTELLARQFNRDFGPEYGTEMAEIMSEYFRLTFQRKPEFLCPHTNNTLLAETPYSLVLNDDELETNAQAWQALTRRMQALDKKLPDNTGFASFELLGYPIYTAAVLAGQATALKRMNTFAAQGRTISRDYSQEVYTSENALNGINAFYNNLGSNKWNHLVTLHPGEKSFELPKSPPEIQAGTNPIAVFGLIISGTDYHYRSDEPLSNAPPPRLPEFSRLTQKTNDFEVTVCGRRYIRWRAKPDARWIHMIQTTGGEETRLQVSVNWSNAPVGEHLQAAIHVSLENSDFEIPIAVSAYNPNPEEISAAHSADFVEDNHVVAMEAENATTRRPSIHARWVDITGLGYNGAAVTIDPVTAPVLNAAKDIIAESPCLEYAFWTHTTGDWKVTVRTLPTFSVEAGKPQRYAIAVDDAPPQIIALPAPANEKDKVWQENVLRNAALTTSHHTLARSGVHTLRIWMVDPGIVLDTIFATTSDAPELGYVGPAETRMSK